MKEVIEGDLNTYIEVRTGAVQRRWGPGTILLSYVENGTRHWGGSIPEDICRAAEALVGIWEASKKQKLSPMLPIIEDSDSDQCPSCGHSAVTLSAVEHTFEYGCDDRTVMLMAVVPVFSCGHQSCKLKWLNECGHVLIEHAITQHLESKNQKKLVVPPGSLVTVIDEQTNTSTVIKGPAIIDDRIFHHEHTS